MRIKNFVLFGFVLCGAVTACGEPDRSAAVEHDSSANAFDAGSTPTTDSGLPDGSSTSSVLLIVMPSAPSLPRCTSPYAPVLESIPAAEQLPVFANATDGLSVGTATAAATAPTNWADVTSVDLPTLSSKLAVFSRLATSICPGAVEFAHEYSVVTAFPPAADVNGSTAISKDDPRFAAWATKVLSVDYGAGVTTIWQTPDRALGPATEDTTDIVSLGEGGTVSLGFDVKIADGDGYDLAVFENGFADNYLELAFVEVSSDGVNFVRFDSASLVSANVGAYGTLDPTQFEGLAGKYRIGYGVPFDLAWLRARPEVQSGLVRLDQITAVRVVDIIGDGRNRDSFGHVIYDPYPTVGSAGFDLDAIGVLNAAP